MGESLLSLVKGYITQSHNMVTWYIFLWKVQEVYIGMDSMAGSKSLMRWWEEVGIYLSVTWSTAEAAV